MINISIFSLEWWISWRWHRFDPIGARAYGAYVAPTGSPSSTELLKSLGADEVINYRSVNLSSYLSTNFGGNEMFDVVLDTQGVSELYHASPGFLKVLIILSRSPQTVARQSQFVQIALVNVSRHLWTPFRLGRLRHRGHWNTGFEGLPPRYFWRRVSQIQIHSYQTNCLSFFTCDMGLSSR